MRIVTFLAFIYASVCARVVLSSASASTKEHQVPFNRTALYHRFVRRVPCDVQVATEHSLIATESTIDYFPAFHGTGSIHEQVCMPYISLHFTRRTSHPFIRKTLFAHNDSKDCALTKHVEEYWPWGRSRSQFVQHLRIITAGAIALREHKCYISTTITPTPFLPVVDVLSQSLQNESAIPSVAPSSAPRISPSQSPLLDDLLTIDTSMEPTAMVIPSNSPSPSASETDLQLELAFRQGAPLLGPLIIDRPSIVDAVEEDTQSTTDPSLQSVSIDEASQQPMETPEFHVHTLSRGAVIAHYDDEDRMHEEPPPMAYQNAEKNPELARHLPPGYRRGSKEDIEYFNSEPEDVNYDDSYKEEEEGEQEDKDEDDDDEDNEDAQDMVEGANDFLEQTENSCDASSHPINHVIGYLVSVGYDFYFESVSYDKAILDLI